MSSGRRRPEGAAAFITGRGRKSGDKIGARAQLQETCEGKRKAAAGNGRFVKHTEEEGGAGIAPHGRDSMILCNYCVLVNLQHASTPMPSNTCLLAREPQHSSAPDRARTSVRPVQKPLLVQIKQSDFVCRQRGRCSYVWPSAAMSESSLDRIIHGCYVSALPWSLRSLGGPADRSDFSGLR